MSLVTVLSVSVRPGRLRSYEEGVRRIAERAAEQRTAFHWTAQQVTGGALGVMHFSSVCADWAALGDRESPDLLIRSLFGDVEGRELVETLEDAAVAQRYTVSQDRPDLSYVPENAVALAPLSLITRIRVRPEALDAAETMIRRIAEAIPKTNDPSHLLAYQTLVGDLATYWTVRPLHEMAELDEVLPPSELLTKAFGAGDGAAIYRSGLEAIEHVERELALLRPELSYNG